MSFVGKDTDTTKFVRADGQLAVPAGGGAPTTADYLVKTADAGLSAERVVTDTTSIVLDWSTAGQAKFTRAALTGHVTASANSNATTIASGVVTEAMQVLADNTTQNVSTSKHGYVPKAPSDATKYLDGTGAWSVPSVGSVAFSAITSGTNTTAAMVVETGATMTFHDNTCIFEDDTGGAGTRTCELVYADGGTGSYGFTVSLPSITGIVIVDQGTQTIDGVKTFSTAQIFGLGFKVTEGSNLRMGASTLKAGTVTVSNTSVTANTRIFLTGQNSSGTHGELTVSARSAGTSFTITSSSGTDTRSVAWLLIEPS